MQCNFVKTDVLHRSGKPYWICSREGCDRRCVSIDGNCRSHCGPPSVPAMRSLADIAQGVGPVRHTAESLPCVHRGEATGDTVDCGCGGGGQALPVYRCATLGLCTVTAGSTTQKVDGVKVIVCLGCDRRG